MLTSLRRRPIIAALIGIVLVGFAAVVLVRQNEGFSCDDHRFDSRAWRAAFTTRPRGSEQLALDAKTISRCDVFTGQDVSTLREQLGPPTLKSDSSWSYSLTDKPTTGVAWLSFRINRSQQVVEAAMASM